MFVTTRLRRRLSAWHQRCIFYNRSFVYPEGIGMKLRVRAIGLVVALFVSTAAALVPKVQAQETSPDTAKRKVKTKVVPDFPPLAKQMNVTGKVKIEATISPDGRVISTKVVGGSPLLVSSALDAIKKWRFEAAPKESIEIVEFDFN
jgi:TonB family protein